MIFVLFDLFPCSCNLTLQFFLCIYICPLGILISSSNSLTLRSWFSSVSMIGNPFSGLVRITVRVLTS